MIKLIVANLKMMVRNKQSLFWSLVFPLIFTVIFGLFFGSGTMNTGTVELVSNSDSKLSASLVDLLKSQDKIFKIDQQSNLDDAKALMKKGKAGAIVYIPAGFGDAGQSATTKLTVITDPGAAQTSVAVESVLGGFLTQANYQAFNIKPIFSFDEQKLDASSSFGYFDFVLIGIIGMAMMNSAVQGLAISMSRYKDGKILKRITTTPLPSWKFVVAQVISQLLENAVQVGIIVFVGVKFFHAHVGNLPALLFLSLVAALLFQLLGFFIAAMSKNSNAAEGMATAITTPMMFLSGVFFPIDSLPKWFYGVVQYLPLSPLLRLMRLVSLESAKIWDNPRETWIILIWIVALLVLTIKKFKLNEE